MRFEKKTRTVRLGFSLLAALLSACLLLFSAPAASATSETIQKPKKVDLVPDALIFPGSGPVHHALVVEKIKQKIHLYEYKQDEYFLVNTYDCTTGRNAGPKMYRGDTKTPQGYYTFISKQLGRYLKPAYGVMAFPTDYPNFWDQVQGRSGGGIFMHGTNRPLGTRLSGGCIRLNNWDIKVIQNYVLLHDTPFILYENIRFKNVKDVKREALKIKSFIREWKKAWEKKDFEKYKSFYSPKFRSSRGSGYQSWMTAQARNINNQGSYRHDLDSVRIYRHHEVIVVVVTENGPGGKSFQKRLYLSEGKDGYRIFLEEYRRTPRGLKQQILEVKSEEKPRRAPGLDHLGQLGSVSKDGDEELEEEKAEGFQPERDDSAFQAARAGRQDLVVNSSRPPALPQVAQGRNYVINLLATDDPRRAESLLKKLNDLPFSVYSVSARINGRKMYGVRIGFFGGKKDAEKLGRHLAAHYRLPVPWVLKANPQELAKYAR